MRKFIVAAVIVVVAGLLAAAVYVSKTPLPIVENNGAGSEANARNSPDSLRIETVADNLEAPWAIDFAPNGDILFTERSGRIRLIEDGELVEEPLIELPPAPAEGGTLGVALDPNFPTERYVYVYYTTDEQFNRISRFRLVEHQLRDEDILIDNIPGSSIHNGGRIRFGPDGQLYAGTGDANRPELAQDPGSLAGKILRLEKDGQIPVNNPDNSSYVYTLGHRNVQGLAWGSDGNMYASEHGPQAMDEINRIEASGNYGWPDVSGHIELGPGDAPVGNYRNPVIDSGSDTWAPSGLEYYEGTSLPQEWHSKLLFAGLRSQALWRLDPDNEELEALFDGRFGRLRDVRSGPDGHIYILTNNRDGRGDPEEDDDKILRLIPASD